ncbi:MAG TPA: PxKF domain-containing protein [Haliangium sp.]|nr:PxKF domain-containing protein [Haliangium sp.]
MALLAGIPIHLGRAPAAHAGAVLSDPGCAANAMPRNDDDYSGPIPMGFDFLFGNQFHSELSISTNGFVKFSPQGPVWWQLREWQSFSIPLIALYHADADTRAAGSDQVTYGPITFAGRPALCINWVNIGYFDAHYDQLNSFQLILVDRNDVGPGDVDIVMNYDTLLWDGGDGDPAGARVGIYDGTSVVHEFAGSRLEGALVDTGANALIAGSRGSAVLGRYVFEMRNGLPPDTAVIEGTVLEENGVPVASALVQACADCAGFDNVCVLGSTDASGHYSLSGFDQAAIAGCPDWNVEVFAPAGTNYLPPPAALVSFAPGDQIIAGVDVALENPPEVPSNVDISPSRGGDVGAVPVVFWAEPLTLTMDGCGSVLTATDPIARYEITQVGEGGEPVTIRSGDMIETPVFSGHYVATVGSLQPNHGLVTVTMTLTCADELPEDGIPPATGSFSFNAYIDPSGWVLSTRGEPIVGAQVTLYRAESPFGPFEIVPDGSAIMAPKNRRNPDVTDGAGHFGWDVVAGYYVVRAEYPGCVSPDNPDQAYVETDVLPVPPEWLDLHLYLDCEAITPPELSVPEHVLAEATSAAGAVVEYEVWAYDGRDGEVPVACWPQSGEEFPVGLTEVECSASDSSGNTAYASFPVLVSYAWTDVLPPLDPGGNNPLKQGRTVPVKFALTGASAGITNAVADLYVAPLSGGVPGPEVPAKSSGKASDGSRFRYDAGEGIYIFNWSTKGLAAGSYRLRIDLGDGALHTVAVELR